MLPIHVSDTAATGQDGSILRMQGAEGCKHVAAANLDLDQLIFSHADQKSTFLRAAMFNHFQVKVAIYETNVVALLFSRIFHCNTLTQLSIFINGSKKTFKNNMHVKMHLLSFK